MAKLLSDVRTGIRAYLDEANQADFLNTEVDRAANYAYHDLISEVMEVWEEYYLTTIPKKISTIANKQEYSLDTSLIKIRRVEINYKPSDSNSKPLRARVIKIDELPFYLGDTNVGGSALFSCGYYIIGNQSTQNIGFIPIPTEVGTDNVSVWGISAPSDLSAASDNVNIPYPDRFTQLIELRAAVDLLRKGQQAEPEAARYMQEYMAGVSRMKTFLSERQADGVRTIEDSAMEDIAFDMSL